MDGGRQEIFNTSDLEYSGLAAEDMMGSLESSGLLQQRIDFGRICDLSLIQTGYRESISSSASDWWE
jgi:hypothetical protein